MADAISWSLHLSVREGCLDDFKSLVPEMVESTRAEEGALIYEWFLSPDERTCHIYERYADSEAALAHLGTFGARFAERFLACLEPTGFFVYGDPSAEVREILNGFGAAYLGQFSGFGR